jgi:hypothetical protein
LEEELQHGIKGTEYFLKLDTDLYDRVGYLDEMKAHREERHRKQQKQQPPLQQRRGCGGGLLRPPPPQPQQPPPASFPTAASGGAGVGLSPSNSTGSLFQHHQQHSQRPIRIEVYVFLPLL